MLLQPGHVPKALGQACSAGDLDGSARLAGSPLAPGGMVWMVWLPGGHTYGCRCCRRAVRGCSPLVLMPAAGIVMAAVVGASTSSERRPGSAGIAALQLGLHSEPIHSPLKHMVAGTCQTGFQLC